MHGSCTAGVERRIATSAALLVALIAQLAQSARAQDPDDAGWVAVQGRVVDGAGQPVAGVVVADFWTFDEARPIGHGEVLEWKDTERGREVLRTQDLRSDADGRFAGRLQCPRGKSLLLALTADGELGGSVEVDRDAKNDALTITLVPTVRVHGTFVCEELAEGVTWTNVYMSSLPARHRVASCSSDSGAFDLRLPPGHWQFDGYGAGLRDLLRPLKLDADVRDLDLGEVELRAEYLALMRGKQLPEWTVTDARGIDLADSKLAAFRGKWLLVEFWGFW
ncbi:MAG: hypothetical protein R3F56_10400 [Planctomycetota bacterium]